jgi:soluble lytic murein transglycosylase
VPSELEKFRDGELPKEAHRINPTAGKRVIGRITRFLLTSLVLAIQIGSMAQDSRTDSVRLPASLDPLVPAYPAPLERALKALKLGIELFQKDEYAASLAALPDEASAKSTALVDYVLFYRAKSSLMLGRSGEALRDFRLVQNTYPNSLLYADAVLGECQAHLKQEDTAAALAVLRNPRLAGNAEALYYQGRALENSDRLKAIDLYLRVFCDYVNSEAASPALDRLLALSPKALARTENYKSLLVRSENLLRAGRTREARTLLVRLGRVSSPDRLSSEKRTVLFADAEYHLGKATAVLPLLRKVTSADPALHARALYLQGACYQRLKREESFLKTRDRALELYPQSPYTERLMAAVAAHFDVSYEIEKAQAAYRTLYDHFSRGEYADRALWRSSFLAYVRGEHGEALQGFYGYLRAHPDPTDAIPAIYWMARCYESLGDRAHSAQLLERVLALASQSYYSRRAAEARQALMKSGRMEDRVYPGLDFDDLAKAVGEIHLPLAAVTGPSATSSEIIERARQLAAADLPELASSELRRGLRHSPSDRALSYLLSRVYEMQGDYYSAISTLRQNFPDYNDRPADSLPSEVWELLFPVKHWDTIAQRARKYDLDPNLVLAIIRQESAFQERARSAANARGLMQVLPSTGRRVARPAGVTRYTVRKLYLPESNIAVGTHHLASLLRQYDNREELALAAYNAGDNRADLWEKLFGLTDMAVFVERIPFSETRAYIKQVLTNQAHYASLTARLTAAGH